MQRRHLIKSILGIGAFSLFETIFAKGSSSQSQAGLEAEKYFKVEVKYRPQNGEAFNISNFYEEMPLWLEQDKFLAVRESHMKSGALIEYHKKIEKNSFSIFYTFRSKEDYQDFIAKCRPFVNRSIQASLSFTEKAIFHS